uniref:F-box/LRR-repeat protein 16 n=1 Tax=Cacopsylla melanoneura TaxID=428564 RepID=A0A8D9B890_9HEMI
MSSQGVVERATSEISKRINNLTLGKNKANAKHNNTNNNNNNNQTNTIKTSVMERVTNVFCGSGHIPSSHQNHPETKTTATKTSYRSKSANNVVTSSITPSLLKRKIPNPNSTLIGYHRNNNFTNITNISDLMLDETFLAKFFFYFSPLERTTLAQVCFKWKEVLNKNPKYWTGLIPVIRCKELRPVHINDMNKLYSSIVRRNFQCISLLSATDEDVVSFVSAFPLATKHIRSLNLSCSSVTDRGLETLMDHLQNLFELELIGCNELTEAGLWACLSPRIVSLTLSDCINIADEAVGAVAQLLPSLYEFTLQAYHVTDAALGFFSPKQSHTLTILRLNSCWEVTNHGIVNIVHSLPNLTVLSLSGCSKITDDGVELIAENLQSLRCLDLSWCPRITDASLEYIACDLNNLEELTLDRCIHITDIGVGYISTMVNLTKLFLRWCSQVRDFGIQHLCNMRNLQVLSVAGCPLLSASGLSSLIQLRHLRELELTNCPGASQELFDYIREHLPRCLIIE